MCVLTRHMIHRSPHLDIILTNAFTNKYMARTKCICLRQSIFFIIVLFIRW